VYRCWEGDEEDIDEDIEEEDGIEEEDIEICNRLDTEAMLGPAAPPPAAPPPAAPPPALPPAPSLGWPVGCPDCPRG
jgi:hypothetical protein